jgi:hypothetical protein
LLLDTGSNNVFIGEKAGRNAIGEGNVFLGHAVGHSETGSNLLYIDNSSTPTPLIYGKFDTDELTVNGALDVTGVISGSGSGLTSLNGSNISSGTVADARLSSAITKLGQTIETGEIVDGTIADADINGSAAIGFGKLAIIKADIDGLNVDADTLDGIDSAGFLQAGGTVTGLVQSIANGDSYFTGGNVGVGITTPSTAFQVNGTITATNITVSGTTVTNLLEITGGSDLAEMFDVAEGTKIEPGMVVVIDPDNVGKLKLTNQAYDKKVAGVVSGAGGINPGVILQQESSIADGKYPIALAGRVWVKCDASLSVIEPGDMLTTSSLEGFAMKAEESVLAQGAILGKAMSGLDNGTGLVLVLITLQ